MVVKAQYLVSMSNRGTAADSPHHPGCGKVVGCHVQFGFAQFVEAAALAVEGNFDGFQEVEDLRAVCNLRETRRSQEHGSQGSEQMSFQ